MNDNFKKIFFEWLFQKEKTFNPFTRYLSEESKKWPNIKQPKIRKYGKV